MILEPINIHEFLQNHSGDEDEGLYLCEDRGHYFVSSISLLENLDATMPDNCNHGCLYVDDVARKQCIPVNKLTKLARIKP